MKFIKFSFSLALLLTACQQTPNVPATNTARPVMPTQTSVVSPTPTKDPLEGAPEGATGKDKDSNYIKETAEGIFTWTVVNGPDGSPILSTWTETRINPSASDLAGGFPPLLEKNNGKLLKGDSVPLSIVAQSGFAFPFISHPDNPPNSSGESFSAYFVTMITDLDDTAWNNLLEGKHPMIEFMNGTTKNIWDTSKGVLVVGMNPLELTQANFPDLVVCTSTVRFDGNVSYTYTAFTTPEGQLVILTTTDHPETLTPKQALRMWIGPMENAVVNGSVSETNFLGTQRMVNSALRDEDPHFVIGPKQ